MRNNPDLDAACFPLSLTEEKDWQHDALGGTKYIYIYIYIDAYIQIYIICAYRHSTFLPEAVTLITVFSNSKELLPVPSVGTHRVRRHGTDYICMYVRADECGQPWKEEQDENKRERIAEGKGARSAKSEKGSHSGQLITRELTRRFQYFFHLQHQARPIRSLMRVYEHLA